MGCRMRCLHPVSAVTFIPRSRFPFNWRKCRLRHLGRHSPASPTSLGTYVLSRKTLAAMIHVTDERFRVTWTSDDFRRIRPNRSEYATIASRSLFLCDGCFLFAAGGKNFQTQVMENGVLKTVPGYAMVQGIFIGVVAAFVIFITTLGPEYVQALAFLTWGSF